LHISLKIYTISGSYFSPASPGLVCDASTPPSPIDVVVAVGTEVPTSEVNVLVDGVNSMGFVTPNPNTPPPDVDVVVPPKAKPVP
jgi:hypothetical protein